MGYTTAWQGIRKVFLPRMRGDMGKKYFIGEIPEATLEGIGSRGYSLMRVNAEDVLDGDRMHVRIPHAEELMFTPVYGWKLAEAGRPYAADYLILDPPAPEGDEWKPDYQELVMWTERLQECLDKMPRKP